MINFGKNIHYLRLRKALTQDKISESMAFTRTQWANYEKGASYPKFKDLIKIARYFDISESDLIHSNLRDEHSNDPVLSENKSLKIKNLNLQSFNLRTDRDIQRQLIPIYNLEATAGLVELFRGSEELEVLDTMSIPNLPRCDGAVYVAGDSMHPLLKNGDIVAYRKVNDLENDIFWGEIYLISIAVDDEEFVTIKYIQKSEKGLEYIKLVSENKHHQDKDVHLNKVRALALIKATVRLNTMN